MSFVSNSQNYNIITENELSQVLSNYNSEFVISIVQDMLSKRFQVLPMVPPPNVVGEWEQNFKAIFSTYGEYGRDEILKVREETYKEIIGIICKEFNLNFTVDETVDLYSAAYTLYDIFACNFGTNIISFFTNFIYKERDSLFDTISSDLANRDIEGIYGKKIFKDQKLGVINASISTLIYSVIPSMDIQFYQIIYTIFGNKTPKSNYILSIISTNSNFFNDSIIPFINSDIKPEIITSIRLNLQELAISSGQLVNKSDLVVSNNEDSQEENKQ